MIEDHVHHQLEILVEHAHDFRWLALLAHGGEPTDVREQQRHFREGAALFQLQLAGHHLFDQVGREQTLELGAGLRFLLDLARQHRVVDGGGGLVADAGEDLQIFLAEGVGRHHGVQVHDTQQLVVVDERHGHGGTNALHDDGTRALKPAVHAGVRGKHGRFLLDHLVQDGPGKNDLLGTAVPRLGDAGLRDAVFHQKDDPAIGRDQIERLHDDLFQQEVDVDLKPDGAA